MKSRAVVRNASIKNGEILIDEDKIIGKPLFEELPPEYKMKEKEDFMRWVARCAGYISECNAKTQALKKRLHKEGQTFTISIKYLVE